MKLIKKIWAFKKGKWAIGILFFFGFLALFGDFIANDKPIYCKYENQYYFPILHGYSESLGLSKNYVFLNRSVWQDLELQKSLYPIVKFDASSIDKNSNSFAKPGSEIDKGKKYWLGSDAIGRDVAAGIVQGSRKTIMIAFFAMLISCLIGFLLGILSGYFGDHSFSLNIWTLIISSIILFFIWFQWVFGHWSFLVSCLCSIVLLMFIIFLNKIWEGKQKVDIPFDNLIMRTVEIFKSIPALFILLALLALMSKPGIISLIVIIGLLRWPTITRVLRAELLKLKTKEFVTSARALGLSHFQIITKHVLPNAIPPLLTILAFGFGSTILLETTISFLGIGLGADVVTWGSILSSARNNFSAWWLAVFPGLAIFLMVIACNYLGDTLNEINLRSR